MDNTPDYIVLRRHPDLPADFRLPEGYDGRWMDRRDIRCGPPSERAEAMASAVAVATGRFEVRGDGAVAEVWEFQV